MGAPRLAYIQTEDWAFAMHRFQMARAARDAGFEVHLLARSSDRKAQIEAEGFTFHPLTWERRRISPQATLGSIREVRQVLRQIAPDVVHNVSLKPVVVGSLAARGLPGVAIVNGIEGLGSNFLSRSLKARAIKAALVTVLPMVTNRPRTLTIVQNRDDEAAVLAMGVDPAKMTLVPGTGIDAHLMTPMPEPSGPIRIGFVGRMIEDKGLRPLIAAHRQLRARGLDVELLLAGTPDTGNPATIGEAELQAWAREPGVTWLGHVDDVTDVWRQCAIAILPSRREGLPKSLLEAAAFGRPLIATDAPGCREVVIPGETGLLVPVNDAAGLARAIETLATSPDLRATLGAGAHRLANGRFSSAEIGRRMVEIYRAMVATGTRPGGPSPS
jgi:glycosyltransferase involved in cell wall biosynthesis